MSMRRISCPSGAETRLKKINVYINIQIYIYIKDWGVSRYILGGISVHLGGYLGTW